MYYGKTSIEPNKFQVCKCLCGKLYSIHFRNKFLCFTLHYAQTIFKLYYFYDDHLTLPRGHHKELTITVH